MKYSSFERQSSNLSGASRGSATSNTLEIKSSDGVQRSIKNGIIIYQSDTLHHSDDRVRCYAYNSNHGGVG